MTAPRTPAATRRNAAAPAEALTQPAPGAELLEACRCKATQCNELAKETR